MLGFSEVPSELYNTRPLMQRIMVVKQTTKGLVKLTETHQSFTAEQIEYIQKLSPHQQIKCIQVFAAFSICSSVLSVKRLKFFQAMGMWTALNIMVNN